MNTIVYSMGYLKISIKVNNLLRLPECLADYLLFNHPRAFPAITLPGFHDPLYLSNQSSYLRASYVPENWFKNASHSKLFCRFYLQQVHTCKLQYVIIIT